MVSDGGDHPSRCLHQRPSAALHLAITIATAFIFGTIPALRATRLELTDTLKAARTSNSSAARVRSHRPSSSPRSRSHSSSWSAPASSSAASSISTASIPASTSKTSFGCKSIQARIKVSDPRSNALFHRDRRPRQRTPRRARRQLLHLHLRTKAVGTTHPRQTASASTRTSTSATTSSATATSPPCSIPLVAGRIFGPQDTRPHPMSPSSASAWQRPSFPRLIPSAAATTSTT